MNGVVAQSLFCDPAVFCRSNANINKPQCSTTNAALARCEVGRVLFCDDLG